MDRRRNLVLNPMKALKIYLLLLFMAASSLAFAQRGGQPVDPERMQAARIAYITTRISLKTEQAEKFGLYSIHSPNLEKPPCVPWETSAKG